MAFSFPAHAMPTCIERTVVLKFLQERHNEVPVSQGVANNGAPVEVLASEDGGWSLLITMPGGGSCLVASGEDWRNLPRYIPGSDS